MDDEAEFERQLAENRAISGESIILLSLFKEGNGDCVFNRHSANL